MDLGIPAMDLPNDVPAPLNPNFILPNNNPNRVRFQNPCGFTEEDNVEEPNEKLKTSGLDETSEIKADDTFSILDV
jgi:hypothetical protein